MLKPLGKSLLAPASLLLALLASNPAGAATFERDGRHGDADRATAGEFHLADNRHADRHGDRDDDRRGRRGDRDWDRGRDRDRDDWRRGPPRHSHGPVIIVRPAPRYYLPPPRLYYRERYAYPRRPYYGDPAASFAGALIGGIIGSSMNQWDHNHAAYVLETAPTGQRIQWRNPDSGYDYAIVPTRTYQVQAGQYCREYTTWGRIGGREQELYGQACRMPDGSWRIAG